MKSVKTLQKDIQAKVSLIDDVDILLHVLEYADAALNSHKASVHLDELRRRTIRN